MSQSFYNPGSAIDSDHILYPYGIPPSTTEYRRGPPFFCLGHPWWKGFEGVGPGSDKITNEDDLVCRFINYTTPAIRVPPVVGTLGSFLGMLTGVRNMGIAINIQLAKQCHFYAYNSWLLGIMSFIHFRRDQAARKYMIHQLAKVMAGDGPTGHPHGTDLNGNSIAVGVKKTFEKNLSFINKKAFEKDINQFKQFNSLQRAQPTSWLMDQEFLTSGFYSHFYSDAGECTRELQYVDYPPAAVRAGALPEGSPSAEALNLVDEIGNHGSWPCSAPNKCNPSAGLKKNKKLYCVLQCKSGAGLQKSNFSSFQPRHKIKSQSFRQTFWRQNRTR